MIMKETKKIKMITHKSDLDGMGCAIIMKSYAKLLNNSNIGYQLEVDVDYCDYSNTLSTLQEFIESGKYKEYNGLYLTDLALEKEETVECLDLLIRRNVFDYDLKLIDHHEDSYIKASDRGYSLIDISGNRSAAEILFDYLNDGGVDMPDVIRSFSTYVSLYDTWRWTKVDDSLPELLNINCFNKVKNENDIPGYVDYMVDLLLSKNVLIEEDDKESICEAIRLRDALISRKLNDVYPYTIKEGYRVGVVFTTESEYKQRSLIGSKVCEGNPNLDFAAIINVDSEKMSFRGIREDINLNELAHNYNGGGHPKAAGAKISNFNEISGLEDFKSILDNTYVGISQNKQQVKNILKLIFG